MTLDDFWFQAAGGPGPGPGPFPIGNSLRFRRGSSTYLERTATVAGNGRQWTVSFWRKWSLGSSSSNDAHDMFACPNGGTAFYTYSGSGDAFGRLFFANHTTGTPYNRTDGRYRDPGAWDHIVASVDMDQADGQDQQKIYINGVRVPTNSPQNPPAGVTHTWNTAVVHRIGTGTTEFFDGYMAEFHNIDGTTLGPETFGEFNADGVWVPREVELERSNKILGGTFGWWTREVNNIQNLFDGSTSSYASGSGGTGGGIWWQAPQPIQYTTSVEVFTNGGGGARADDDGSISTPGGPGWTTVRTGAGEFTRLTIHADAGGGYSTNWSAIRVDGVILTNTADRGDYGENGFALDFSDPGNIGADHSGNGNNWTPTGFELTDTTSTSYDWMADSPTDNYSTLNPLRRSAGTFSEANLRGTTANSGSVNIGLISNTHHIPPTGRYYWENNIIADPGPHIVLGCFKEREPSQTSTDRIGAYYLGGTLYSNGSAHQTGQTASPVGSVVGVACDRDNSTVTFFSNGTQVGNPVPIDSEDGNFLLAAFYRSTSSGSGNSISINFGQLPFQHTPPAGFEPLSTAELPDVAITNPSEHFQTVLSTGGIGFGTIQYGGDHPTSTRAQHDGRLAVEDGWTGPIFDWAAQVRADTLNGFDDWYVPSIQEFYLLYTVFKSNTGPTSFGWSSNYTVPPINTGGTTQTVFPAFQEGGAEFIPWYGYHWSMTPSGAGAGIKFYFNDGNTDSPSNGGQYQYARLVRREAFTGSEPAVGSAYAGGFLAGFMSDTENGAADWALIVSPSDGGQYGRSAPILDVAQRTFPNGLWWIKDRANSNQHQLVDSVRGGNLAFQCPAGGNEQTYSAPAGNSVAWCWNADEAFTGSGATIASSGQRDVAAGFSIISYSGNGQGDQTVAHGLNDTPEFVIARRRIIGASNPGFNVYHKDLPAGTFLWLDKNNGQTTGAQGYWVNNLFSPDFIGVGDDAYGPNAGGSDQIAYCWHSVPGYSAFGSYQGNSSSDGPFIYTGFRVAWLLCKSLTSGPSWLLYDSARTPYNPANLWFHPNYPYAENGPSIPVDFLSNGFKIRQSGSSINEPGTTIYAAFAEHPFGGGNVSPAPAR